MVRTCIIFKILKIGKLTISVAFDIVLFLVTPVVVLPLSMLPFLTCCVLTLLCAAIATA